MSNDDEMPTDPKILEQMKKFLSSTDFLAMDLKHADRTDEQIDAIADEIGPGDKQYRSSLYRLRLDARRSLLDRLANDVLHGRPIDDYRLQNWLFTFLDAEAKKIKPRGRKDDSTRLYHIAKWVEGKKRQGMTEVKAIAAIAEANNLSEGRVKNIYQERRKIVQGHLDEIERKGKEADDSE